MKDEKEIRSIKEGLDKQFSSVVSQYTTAKKYYDQEMDLGKLPADVVKYKPPTAREQVNTAVDHIMGLGQKVTVPVWSKSADAANMVSKLESFGMYFIKHLDRTYRQFRRNRMRHGIEYGMFAFKYGYDPRFGPLREEFDDPGEFSIAQNNFDELCERTFPFFFRGVHPMNVKFDLYDPPKFVVEEFTKKAVNIQNDYPEWKIGDRDLFEDVGWWEFWSNDTLAYFVDDTVLEIKPNPYGFIPYEFGIAGFGEESEDASPEDLIVSMLAPSFSAYTMEARMKTAVQALLEYHAFGKPTMDKMPGNDVNIASAPGEVSYIPKAYNYRNEAPNQINPDLYRFLEIVRADTEKTMPQVVQGLWPKGVTSGYMGAMSVGQARLRLEALQGAWEVALSRTLNNIIYLAKNVVKEPIGILGNLAGGSDVITIKPTELDPSKMHFYVSLDAESPEDRDRRIQLGMSLQDRRALSDKTIVRRYYDEDPEYEEEQKMVEAALKDPNLSMQLAMSIMQEIGMTEVLQMIQQGQIQGMNPNQGGEVRQPNSGQRKKMRLGPTGENNSRAEMEGAPQ